MPVASRSTPGPCGVGACDRYRWGCHPLAVVPWFRSIFFIVVRVFVAASFGGLELLAQRGFQLRGKGRVVLEELAGVLLALTDALAVVAVPGARLLDQLGFHAHVDQFAFAGNAFAVEDLGDDLL